MPSGIHKLRELTTLAIGGNLFDTAHLEFVYKLDTLKTLALQENRLTYLIDQFDNLKNLESLSIWGTGINELPTTLGLITP